MAGVRRSTHVVNRAPAVVGVITESLSKIQTTIVSFQV